MNATAATSDVFHDRRIKNSRKSSKKNKNKKKDLVDLEVTQ